LLGAGEPKLLLGWIPNEIVWVARGESPFTLTYGRRDAKPSAYPIESLVPGYSRDADLDAKVASTEPAASVNISRSGRAHRARRTRRAGRTNRRQALDALGGARAGRRVPWLDGMETLEANGQVEGTQRAARYLVTIVAAFFGRHL